MVASRVNDEIFSHFKSFKTNNEFNKKLSFPILLDLTFDLFMRIDEFLIKYRVPLPFGGTLLVIARKNNI